MSTVVNARDVLLQAASTRVEDVTLPSNYDTSGDHTGTLSGSNQTNFQNSQITLSSTGVLQNAGGGQITNGASIGSLNAGNITTGTLSASRIGAGSITASKIDSGAITTDKLDALAVTSDKIASNAIVAIKIAANAITADKINTNAVTSDKISANAITAGKIDVSTLSAITANLGTVNAGQITGGADINITGRAQFSGNYTDGGNNAAVHANASKGATYGVFARAGVAGSAIIGLSDGSGRTGVTGSCTVSGGFGIKAIGTGGATALDVNGPISISTQTISNLTAGYANGVDGSDVSGTVASAINASNATNATNASNSNSLGNVSETGWCRQLVTDSGTAPASSRGFVLTSTVSGIRTRATGGRNVVIESFSDDRLKTGSAPETLGLDFVKNLTPITYRVKDNPRILHHGLSAQDNKRLIARDDDALAITHEDGNMGVDYMSMVSVLVKAVQELAAEVEILKKQRGK